MGLGGELSRYGSSRVSVPHILIPNGALATHFTFLREIPLFSRYELRSTLLSWDNKWVSPLVL